MGYSTVKSIEKAMSVLELLTDRALENRPLTLSEITKETAIPQVTARNILRTLEKCGYVTRIRHGQYEEGERCCKLFRSSGIIRHLTVAAAPILQKLSHDLNESVLLATIVNGKRVELIRCRVSHDNLKAPEWHANEEFYSMRTTRVMLAWFSKTQLEYFIERNKLPAYNAWPEVNNSSANLKHELKKIRINGGCRDIYGETLAIAVPVKNKAGDIVASLGCYMLCRRTDRNGIDAIFRQLHQSTEDITRSLDLDSGRIAP